MDLGTPATRAELLRVEMLIDPRQHGSGPPHRLVEQLARRAVQVERRLGERGQKLPAPLPRDAEPVREYREWQRLRERNDSVDLTTGKGVADQLPRRRLGRAPQVAAHRRGEHRGDHLPGPGVLRRIGLLQLAARAPGRSAAQVGVSGAGRGVTFRGPAGRIARRCGGRRPTPGGVPARRPAPLPQPRVGGVRIGEGLLREQVEVAGRPGRRRTRHRRRHQLVLADRSAVNRW